MKFVLIIAFIVAATGQPDVKTLGPYPHDVCRAFADLAKKTFPSEVVAKCVGVEDDTWEAG